MDKFVRCPPEALVWEQRRWRLLEEHQDVAIAQLIQKSIFFFAGKRQEKVRVGLLSCVYWTKIGFYVLGRVLAVKIF